MVKGRNTASSNVFGVSLGFAFDAWDIPDPTWNLGGRFASGDRAVGITGSYSWWRPDDDVVGDTIVVGATYRPGPARWRLRPALLVGAWRTARAGESWAPALGAGFSWGGRFGGNFGTAFMRPRGLTYAVSRLGVYYALR